MPRRYYRSCLPRYISIHVLLYIRVCHPHTGFYIAIKLVADRSLSRLLFDSPQITTATSIVKSISSALNTCPSQYYVLLRQSGVHSGDYSRDGSVPHLQRRLAGEDKTVRSSSSAAEVRGDVDRQALVDELREHCGADVLELKDTCEHIQISVAQWWQNGIANFSKLRSNRWISHPAPYRK